MGEPAKNDYKGKDVSFDFDDTLWTEEVFEYAQELISMGYIPWIVTARYKETPNNMYKGYIVDNAPVYEVANKLGIPEERIIFLNHTEKAEYFIDNPNFLFHLDDSFFDVVYPMNSNEDCKVPAVWYNETFSKWKEKLSVFL